MVLLILISFMFIVGLVYWIEKKQEEIEKVMPKPCPMDAKLCLDGSSVGRIGPNCEFAPCPGGKNMPENTPVSDPNKPPKPIGGDKDEHGCLPAAGYSWCEEKQKCLRTWEESCADEKSSDNNSLEL